MSNEPQIVDVTKVCVPDDYAGTRRTSHFQDYIGHGVAHKPAPNAAFRKRNRDCLEKERLKMEETEADKIQIDELEPVCDYDELLTAELTSEPRQKNEEVEKVLSSSFHQPEVADPAEKPTAEARKKTGEQDKTPSFHQPEPEVADPDSQPMTDPGSIDIFADDDDPSGSSLSGKAEKITIREDVTIIDDNLEEEAEEKEESLIIEDSDVEDSQVKEITSPKPKQRKTMDWHDGQDGAGVPDDESNNRTSIQKAKASASCPAVSSQVMADREKEIENQLDQALGDAFITAHCFLPDLSHPKSSQYVYSDTEKLKRPERSVSRESYGNSANSTLQLPWMPPSKTSFDNEGDEVPPKSAIFDRLLTTFLAMGAESYVQIETLIHDIRGRKVEGRPRMAALFAYWTEQKNAGREKNVLEIFTFIVELAKEAEKIIPQTVYRLTEKRSASVTLSQKQCACLLAHMFLCTFNARSNFYRIFNTNGEHMKLAVEKIKFMMSYFAQLRYKMPEGSVSFRRKYLFPNNSRWAEEKIKLSNIKLIVSKELSIERARGCSQMDFANKFIGGGVLATGSVQEEIRFLMCPEAMVSMLLCDKMDPLEAIFIVGAQTYSSYDGYGYNLRWRQLCEEDESGNSIFDEFGRIRNEIVAVDALSFNGASSRISQFNTSNIDRELNKLRAGFTDGGGSYTPPIVTGWWGCGAFNGDKELKALIQVLAALVAERTLIFCSFGENKLARSLINVVEKLKQSEGTAGDLYFHLTTFQEARRRYNKYSLFDHIMTLLSEY